MFMIKRIKFLVFASLLLILTVTSVMAEHVGDMSPACKLSALDGTAVHNLEELQGKVVYVDFWASWCPPCVKSFPFLTQLNHDLKDQGLQVIGVNLDEKVADAETFLERFPVDFAIALDAGKQCAKDFGVMAMPSSYLIDRKGVIRHVHQGFRPDEAKDLRAAIEYLLTEPL